LTGVNGMDSETSIYACGYGCPFGGYAMSP